MSSQETQENRNSNRFRKFHLPDWGNIPTFQEEFPEYPKPKPSISLVLYDNEGNEIARKPLTYQIIGGEK